MKKFKFSNKNRKYTLILLILGICITGVLLIYLANQTIQTSQDVEATTITYKKWDEITLEFTGSHGSLNQNSSSPNPFLDYRFTVIFTNGSKNYTVPGYFVGDGLGGSGNKWKAHFTADKEGTWSYTANLTSGPNVAVNGGGSPIIISPSSGSFQVSGESSAGGFYSNCGRLKYAEKHYLQCEKTGQSWIKGGTNSPENFLAGADTGKEANIKTVIDYLGSQEVNSIYFLPNNIGGDGRGDTHPFAFNFTSVGAVTYDNLTHYNVARMNKWNEIFNYALKKGISLEFVLNETESENRGLLGTTLTTQRKLFYRELIARYSHLPAVRWIIIEENAFPNEQLKSFAGYIKETDPYKHPIAVHTPVDSLDFYQGLMGNPSFDSASIQFYTIPGSPDNASSFTETWRQKSSIANRPWIIDLDEAILKEDSRFGMTKDNMDDLRRRVLYPGYFSGGNISWYYGYEQDLGMSLWKFQDREPMWKWMSSARRLLSEFPAIANFKPGDDLITSQKHGGGKTQVYYDTGKTFLVYMGKTVNGENATINLSSANGKQLTMQWFNPRTGLYLGSPVNITPSSNFVIGASPQAGSGDREDWVVVFKSNTSTTPSETKAYFEDNGLIVIQPETKPISTGWLTETTTSGFTGPGYIKYNGPDYFSTPGNGLLEYNIYISHPGRYEIRLRANKKNPNPSEENDVWLKTNNGTWYKTYNANQETNVWSWLTQYEITHHTNTPPAFADLNAGINTLYLSGRSKGFYIDRIHLYRPNMVSDSLNTSHPESEYKTIPIPTVPVSCPNGINGINGICGKLTPSLSEDQSKGLSYDLKLSDIVLPNTTFISGKIDFQTCLTPGTNTKHINLYNYLGKGRHESTEVGNGNYPKWVCYNIGDTISITSLPLPDGKTYTQVLGGTEQFKVLGKDTAHKFADISGFIKDNPDIDNDLKYSVKVVIRGNKINNGGEVANDQIYGTPIKFVLPTPTFTPTPTSTLIPVGTTPPPTALTCTKIHTLANDAILNSNVIYKIILNKDALSPDGTVIVRDDYDDNLEIVEKPTWCTQKTSAVQSAVLGISDTYSERGSVLISILFFSLLAGGATYLIVLRNREIIGWKLIKEKPYLAGMLATGAVLVIGSIYFLITQKDVSPTDTPALSTGKYLECNIPAGTDTIAYTMKIKGTVGSTINNTAEVKTGTNPTVQSCSTSFVIKSVEDTVLPSNTATPIPTSDPVVSATPTLTTTPIVDSPPPSSKPTRTPIPSEGEPTAIVTEPPVGLICGKADINNNGRFDIYDFGGYQVGFASYYQKTCDDTEEMRQTYSPCGGKDVVPDEDGAFGKIDIFDFVSFAQRYSKERCNL